MERVSLRERLRRRAPYIGSFMASLALAGSLEMGHDAAAKNVPAGKQPAVVATVETAPIDDFEDLEIYFLEDPSVELPRRHTANEIHRTFIAAGEDMTQSTDGTYNLPDSIPMHTIQQAPKGEERLNGEVCYTDGEIFQLGKSLRKHEKQDVAIVINEAAACSQEEAAAWAYTNENVTAYVSVDERIVAHELGHSRKLGHRAVIGCQYPGSSGFRVDRPLSVMMDDPNCHAVKNEKGEVDEYHSWHSVMGRSATMYQEVYHPLELQTLDPSKFQVKEVEPVAQSISISALDAGLRGITFRLPENHSLHKADPEMESVSITAMRRDDYEGDLPSAEIIVTATSKKLQYDLVAFSIASIDLPDTSFGIGFNIEEVYIDPELGIRVTATQDVEDPEKIRLFVSELKK